MLDKCFVHLTNLGIWQVTVLSHLSRSEVWLILHFGCYREHRCYLELPLHVPHWSQSSLRLLRAIHIFFLHYVKNKYIIHLSCTNMPLEYRCMLIAVLCFQFNNLSAVLRCCVISTSLLAYNLSCSFC